MASISRNFGLLVLAATCVSMSVAPAQDRTPATERDVAAIEKRVLSCDRVAVRSAFALRSRADGHVGEYVDIVLGSTIKSCPLIFLAELKNSGNFVRLDSLVGNLGPNYVDRFKAQARELGARHAKLQKVKDPTLRGVRDKCLDQLNELRAQMKSLSNSALERSGVVGGPRLAAARAAWPAAQRKR